LKDSYLYKAKRRQLVKLLRTMNIQDEGVLAAIQQVPRHFFFESAFYDHAYENKAFPIAAGQTISQPYTVARQTELLNINLPCKILEIGTGSGYQAAVLAEMGAEVYSIEYQPVLYERATELLQRMNYSVHTFYGDGSLGLAQHAPYDKILVTAAAPIVPSTLLEQLNENGCLVIPVGDTEVQEMKRLTKKAGQIIEETFGTFSFVPLLGEQGWK
jgi:protein-L-isoaspartate(D-aspartate) O-methyltransferase